MKGKRVRLCLAIGVLVLLPAGYLIWDQSRIAAGATCPEILLQLDDATTDWAEKEGKDSLAHPSMQELAKLFRGGRTPVCPGHGLYSPGTRSLATTCSIHGHASDRRPNGRTSKVKLLVQDVINQFSRRTTSGGNSCIANLKQFDGAIQQWALENRKQPGELPPPGDIASFLKQSQLPVCPGQGKYTLTPVGVDPQCTRGALGHTL